MSIVIREARPQDVEYLTSFIHMASGGISEYILQDLVDGIEPSELLEVAMFDENTIFFYKNILVAEKNNKIIAASNFYPAEMHGLPAIMRSVMPEDKFEAIRPYVESRVEDSMYIHTMGVSDKYRLSAVGYKIAKKIEEIAKIKGKKCLSAHVWEDNSAVYNGLRMFGFKKVKALKLAKRPEFTYKGDLILLKGPYFS